jgi:UDP-2-acetamido-3-amino-2,3-dideoxy-glucuronate N-acetyltransferase
MIDELRSSARAPGLTLAPDVELPDDARLGANVVLERGVVVGAGCRIEHHAVVGKAPSLGVRSRAQVPAPGTTTVLEDGCVIGCGAIVVAGARIGAGAVVGANVLVRERARLGPGVAIGHGSGIGAGASIGTRTRVGSCVLIAPGSVIEEDCFLGPQVILTDDNTIGRLPADRPLRGATLHRRCRVGAGVIVLPDVEIGEEAMVGAGSLVTESVPPHTLVAGSPARFIRALDPQSISPLPPLQAQPHVVPPTP